MKIADFLFDDPIAPAPLTPASSSLEWSASSIIDRFSAMVKHHPERVAVADGSAQVSYAELDREVSRIADFILHLPLAPETPVGVMTGRSWRFVAAVLGILRAGCAWVPLDPGVPLLRRQRQIEQAEMPLVIADSAQIADLHQLQWRCASLQHVLCVDSEDIDDLSEVHGSLMSTELWDHLAGDRANDVEAGGWKSAFTGRPISAEAMAAFGRNAHDKVAALLQRMGIVAGEARILEIGCASGFTMRHVAPLAGQYVASDLSRRNVERVEAAAKQLGLTQVTGKQLAAHDVDIFAAGSFDIVILNSVVENFPGFGYLRQVLSKVQGLLAQGGAIYLGNLWNLQRREQYLDDLARFAREHVGSGIQTRLDFIEDLFVPAEFVQDWAQERGLCCEVSAIDAPGFDPAPYTFDALLLPNHGRQVVDEKATVLHRYRHDRRALISTAAPEQGWPAVNGEHLAYVLFTSGTTGQPKGVMINQGSVVSLAHAVNTTQLNSPWDNADVQPARQVSCCAPLVFDASVVQIFSTLLGGHTLHLPDEESRREPEALHRFIVQRQLDLIDATPSMFGLLLDYWEATDSGLSRRQHATGQGMARTFILGGEVFGAELARRFYGFEHHADDRLINAYGPTECCVSACQHIMTARNWQETLPPPIGAAIPGVSIRLCDDNGRAVPVGVVGEIQIGGAGVGRGYLHDDQLTADRFLRDELGQHWYRTGDLGRWLGNGLLHYVGREDGQVKIRGNRIELSDIEAALHSYPYVRRAAVVARAPESRNGQQDSGADRTLVAYIIPHEGFDAAACRAYLDGCLPTYMLPSWLLTVQELPLTGNDKLDLSKLPSPFDSDIRQAQVQQPLTTATEKTVAVLMGKVLEQVIEDAQADFFALGGHSVLAVRFLGALKREFDIKLPLADLFVCSSVAALAQRIEQRHQQAHRRSPLVAVNVEGSQVPLVCFHPVGGNVLCYQALAEELGPDQPVYMVEAQGLEEGMPPLPTVEDMVAAYLPAIREALPQGPIRLAGWSFGGLLAVEAAYRLRRMGVDVRELMLFDAIAVPDGVRTLLRKDEADYLADLFEELGLVDAETLRPLTPEQRLDLLVERGKGSNMLPDNADRESMRRLLAVFQNNALAAVRYKAPALDELDILLVKPKELTRMSPHLPGDDYNGWRQVTQGQVHLCWMEGTHGQMLVRPFISQLAGHVRDYCQIQYRKRAAVA